MAARRRTTARGAGSRPGKAAPPSPEPARLRARVWVEVGGGPALTDAGADLLEQIEVCGSLSEAARRLGFSYRRAWMLADSMNRRWPWPLLKMATGGKRGGGSGVTELGRRVLRGYRDMQVQLEAFLDRAGAEFGAGLKD